MKTANHRLWRILGGRPYFADVTVRDTPLADRTSLARVPVEWIAAADRGIQAALTELGAPPPVFLVKLVFTHVDTTEDSVHAAAFLATAKFFDRDHEFQLARRADQLIVIRARTD